MMNGNDYFDDSIFGKLKPLTKNIVDYLVANSENLWKLLFYTDATAIPLKSANLTTSQKANMICSTPSEMYDTNTSVNKNILFQMQIDEAFSAAVPQIRIQTGKKGKINPYQGWCEIYFQIIMPNKMLLYIDTVNTVCDRSDAIVYELMKALDQKILPNSVVNSPLFMDKSAPDGVGKNTGVVRDFANTAFNCQYLTLSVLI